MQLLRAQPAADTGGSPAQPSLAGLTAAAERMARAGLRLDGASPDLWAALGAVAAEVRCHEETKVVDACHADHQSRLLATPCEHVTTLPSASATPFHLQPSVREYALSRALQLDPKCVPAWVALARLYAGGGHQGHVGWCSGSWVTEAELVCKRSPPLPLNSFLSLLLRSRHAYLFHHS